MRSIYLLSEMLDRLTLSNSNRSHPEIRLELVACSQLQRNLTSNAMQKVRGNFAQDGRLFKYGLAKELVNTGVNPHAITEFVCILTRSLRYGVHLTTMSTTRC